MEYQTQLCGSNKEKVGLDVSDLYCRDNDTHRCKATAFALWAPTLKPLYTPAYVIYIWIQKVDLSDPD